MAKSKGKKKKSLKRTRSQQSLKTTATVKSTAEGMLQKNPFGYAVEMFESHGVIPYTFRRRNNPERPEDSNLVTTYVPFNLAEIKEALVKVRDDLPNKQIFRRYSIEAIRSAENPDEADVEGLFNLFLDPKSRNEGYHGHHRVTWIFLEDLLPSPQTKLKPDMTAGSIRPDLESVLGSRSICKVMFGIGN